MSNLIHDNNTTISELTKKLATTLTERGLRLTTAESCTGGNLAVALCAEENTAEFYDVGMVVFSDAAKERILGVRHETIERFTAVSEQTVTEMAAKIRDIAEADIGVAMGALGSDAAIEAADIVLMDDDPLKIVKAIRIAKKCMHIVYENIYFAIGIKVLCLILGAVGIANMWLAIFADVGVMVLAVLNAVRALFVKKL